MTNIVKPTRPVLPYEPRDTPVTPDLDKDLPAERFVILADGSNQVKHIDERADVIAGSWESPTLNRVSAQQAAAVMRMTKLILYYVARVDQFLRIEFTANGGRVWTVPKLVDLAQSNQSVRQVMIGSNVTGHDVRFRLRFETNRLVKVVGYRPFLIPAGNLVNVGQ